MEYQGFSEELTERAWLQLVRSCTLHTHCCPNFWKARVTGVEEGLGVLEVPKIGHPITTDEVSVQTGDRGKCYKICI